jgi:hypothetical protein
MENMKYAPPKFSYALKDLANYLGIFEMSEEAVRLKKKNKNESPSLTVPSSFIPPDNLEVVEEHGESDSECKFNHQKQFKSTNQNTKKSKSSMGSPRIVTSK